MLQISIWQEMITLRINKVNRLSDESMQHINYLKGLSQNYRTIPCKNYHGSQGCGRSRFCHFVHISDYEGIKIFVLYKKMISFKLYKLN